MYVHHEFLGVSLTDPLLLQLHNFVRSLPEVQYFLQRLMYILHGVGNNWALWKVQGQSSQLILSPLAGAAHRSERGGPSSLPPLHAAKREKGRSVNECSPESHHLLPPP